MKKILVLLVTLFLFGCDLESENNGEKSTTENTVKKHEMSLLAEVQYDELFDKFYVVFDVTIKNNDDKDFEPYYDFKLFGPQGSTVSRSYIYDGNDNDCTFLNATIRPGGIMTCNIAFEVTHNGNYELEIYDSIWSSNPTQTIYYTIENNQIKEKD